MFKHISIISDENVNVMLDKELAYFRSIIERCQQSEHTIDEVVNMACEEFADTNPNLRKAVRACAFGVFGGLEDEYGPGVAFKASLLTVPGVLTVLRLIDRQIEAEEMERKM